MGGGGAGNPGGAECGVESQQRLHRDAAQLFSFPQAPLLKVAKCLGKKEVGVMVGDWERGWLGNGGWSFCSLLSLLGFYETIMQSYEAGGRGKEERGLGVARSSRDQDSPSFFTLFPPLPLDAQGLTAVLLWKPMLLTSADGTGLR